MNLSGFEGEWIIERRIDDRRVGRQGSLQGRAIFTRDGDDLRYEEEGILRFPGQPDLTARQAYLWQPTGDRVSVLFGDGRPFHMLDLSVPRPTARHFCDPDMYDVRYDFGGWPNWISEWTVAGPRKDHVILTSYRRG